MFFFCLLQLTRLFLYLKRHNKKWSSTEQASNESCYKNLEVPFVNPDRHNECKCCKYHLVKGLTENSLSDKRAFFETGVKRPSTQGCGQWTIRAG